MVVKNVNYLKIGYSGKKNSHVLLKKKRTENQILMVNKKLLPKLLQNLLDILDDDEYYDITIEVGKDPNVRIFRAHMVILNYRSPYFRRILSRNKKKDDGTLTHIKLPNVLPEMFQIILR